jgi:prephenate dehydratase
MPDSIEDLVTELRRQIRALERSRGEQHLIPIEESRDGEIQAALDSLASMNRITRTTAEDVHDVVHALRLAGYRVVRDITTQEADRG